MCTELAEVSAEGDKHFDTSLLGDRLQELAKESLDDQVCRALSYACNYFTGSDGPFTFGPYSPMFVLPMGGDEYSVFPPPLERVDTDVLDIWAVHASDEALHPMPRARLADLLWIRRHGGEQRKWIKTAVEMNIKAAAIPEVEVVERGNMLARAVAICQESNNQDNDLKADALTALAELTQEAIDSAEGLYGVAVNALTALVDAEHPCETILADAIRKYDPDPWRTSDLRALAIKASPDEASKHRLRAESVKGFEEAANLNSGVRRVSLLENARSVALSTGDSKEVERLNGLIQRTDTQGDMKQLEVSLAIDDKVIRSVVEPITGDDSLSDALDRFARYLIPNLSDEAMEQRLLESAQVAPLLALIGRTCLGPDGTVSSLPSGSPERHTADINQQKVQAITCSSGVFGQPVLHDLDERYDMCPSNLVACIGPVIPREVVDTIVAAHERWRSSDHRSAVALLWPTIEPIVRSMCLARGLTTAARKSTSFPQTRPLGELLKNLAPHIDNNYASYLRAALVEGWALNLRNAYAHGHPPKVDHITAYSILFHVVCVLRLIENP